MQEAANRKVGTPSDITVSSIPPCIDNVQHQQHVEELNVILHDISNKFGAVFISNDETFRRADGRPNDGYLLRDGLHWNNQGTNRLAINLQLTSEGVDVNKAKPKRKERTRRVDLNTENPPHDDDTADNFQHAFWQTAQAKGRRVHHTASQRQKRLPTTTARENTARENAPRQESYSER